MKIRTRFSPSPTGYLHIGGVRTTLFSALFAAKHQGTFVLRIEDTDVLRSQEQYAISQQEDLQWLGIHWHEGPGVDGPYGPYWQSQRQAIYLRYYQLLEEKKQIYPCFCTEQALNLERKLQLARSQPPRYSGKCRRLTADEIKHRLQQGDKPAWRFLVPENSQIEFDDIIKGPQQFRSHDIGDFIVRRTDGTAPFLFCNAVDDALMQISHVLRGEDHLANTPRQIMLLQALNLPMPHYGHLSLIVGEDGAKLSKRHGDFSIREMREQGYLPLAILNYLARLGHTNDNQTLLDFDHLACYFNIEKVSRSAARFDRHQLFYWQKMAVQSLDAPMIWRWLGPRVEDQVPITLQTQFVETIKANIVFPDDALKWAKILFHENAQIDSEGIQVIQAAGEQFFVEAESAVDKYGTDMSAILAQMQTTLHLSGKKLFLPFRFALTGQSHGPELTHIAAILGQKKLKHRLGRAFQLASGRENGENSHVKNI